MAAESQTASAWLPVIGGLLVGGVLMCLPEVWAGKVRSLVRDSLSPGQCVVAATVPEAVRPVETSGRESIDSAWQRQARYWQAEAARLKSELAEANQVSEWPAAAITPLLVKPQIHKARVIGWERRGRASFPSAVIRGGTSNQITVDDLVLAPGESILDQGQGSGVAPDDLVLAGRTVIGASLGSVVGPARSSRSPIPSFAGRLRLSACREARRFLVRRAFCQVAAMVGAGCCMSERRSRSLRGTWCLPRYGASPFHHHCSTERLREPNCWPEIPTGRLP